MGKARRPVGVVAAWRDAEVLSAHQHGSWRVGDEVLTGMEILVAKRHIDGMARGDIAAELGMAMKTFDSHMLHIKQKLGVENSLQLAKLAVTSGWVKWTAP